ncbi:MAG: thiamine-phosphate kinase [candidate division Zixibacteria bacterium RBG_16_48_11]|nr:MAG: thiamine-phosphate kinase [candidate division Zixibacteria bacterium RBG_16_48_11]
MKLSQKGEFGLIELIRKKCGWPGKKVILGIGDDAAVIKSDPNKLLVLTTDALIQTVHFNLDYFSFYQLGWRSLAANLSDLAAMGGRPVCCLVTLGLNDGVSVENLMQFYQGVLALSKRFDCPVVGGDIVRSPRQIVISISALGEVEKTKVAKRSGARAGDLICVTGELGEAQAGLELLLKKRKNKSLQFSPALTRKHLLPLPRLAESDFLVHNTKLNSLIDISDGLASDLHQICKESKVGAVIYERKIPLGSKAVQAARLLKKNPLEFALYGGEEYELLFTLTKSQAQRLLCKARFKLTVIGEILPRKEGVSLEKAGQKSKLLPQGYTHF